jgi:hypothetical protein
MEKERENKESFLQEGQKRAKKGDKQQNSNKTITSKKPQPKLRVYSWGLRLAASVFKHRR